MINNMYLYGTIFVPEISQEVCEERIRLLNDNLSRLLEEDYLKRDYHRLTKVSKALSFWIKMRDGRIE